MNHDFKVTVNVTPHEDGVQGMTEKQKQRWDNYDDAGNIAFRSILSEILSCPNNNHFITGDITVGNCTVSLDVRFKEDENAS